MEFSLGAAVFEAFWGEGEISTGTARTPTGGVAGVSLGAVVLESFLREAGLSARVAEEPLGDEVTGTSFGDTVLGEGGISRDAVVTPSDGVGVSLGAENLGDLLEDEAVELSLGTTVFEVFFREGEISSGTVGTPSGRVSLGAAVLGVLVGEVGLGRAVGAPLRDRLIRGSLNASDFGGEGGVTAGAPLGDFGVFCGEGEVTSGRVVATLGVIVAGAFLREEAISVGAMGAPLGDVAAGAFGGDKEVTAGTLLSDRVAEVSLGTGVAGIFFGEVGVTSGTIGATLGGWIRGTSLEAVASMVFGGEGGISAGTVGVSLKNKVAGAFWGDTEVSVGAMGAPLWKGGATVEGTGVPLEDEGTGESSSESVGS